VSTIQGLPSFGSKPVRFPDPRVRATFYRHDGSVVFTDTAVSDSNTGRTSNDIISVTTNKHIGNPVGVWSIQLVPRKQYFTLQPMYRTSSGIEMGASIRPGDWCFIESDNGDGLGYRPLMYGPITDLRRRRTTNEKGTVVTSILVSGSDFGKVLASIAAIEDVTLAQATVLASANIATIATGLDQITGGPEKFLRAIITRFMSPDLNQFFDPMKNAPFTIEDYIDDNLLGKAQITPANLASTLWQQLEQFSNPCVNEMFCDLRPPKGSQLDLVNLVPALVVRQFPFYGEAWNGLTSVVVNRSEVINDDLGKSANDVHNWIRPMDEPAQRQYPGMAPFVESLGAFNPESIKRFGFIRLESPTMYIYDPTASGQPIANLLQTMCGLQTLWHHSNEELVSGTMEMYHRPDIRVGYRLDYTDSEIDENLQFYIEGVQHSINYPGRSSTTVTLTRGRDINDARFTDSLLTLQAKGVIQGLGSTVERVQQVFGTTQSGIDPVASEDVGFA
jgi:hypothetical protein